MQFHWPFWARPNQLEPDGDWRTWLILAGRGFGKTRTGAEWVRDQVKKGARRIALIAETQRDLEKVMCEGDSGILGICSPEERPYYQKKPVQLTFPNGAIALGFNATEPDQLRGPQFDVAWCDELAKWRYARETWDQLQFGLRIGDFPRCCVTTTPRAIPIIKEFIASSSVCVTRGVTNDNANNLAPSFVDEVTRKYAGTRLGRQELNAEILDDIPGALWTREMIDRTRVAELPEMRRVVVAIDPSGTNGSDDGDSIGIVVAGIGIDGRGYVIEDCSCSLSPDGWARRAINAYYQHKADRIVAEVNYGGAMVESIIRSVDRSVSYKSVTASRGKILRAEPISALYEQGRISHCTGLEALEDQMMMMTSGGYAGEKSPDRVDALVWALTELMMTHQPPPASSALITIPKMVTPFARR